MQRWRKIWKAIMRNLAMGMEKDSILPEDLEILSRTKTIHYIDVREPNEYRSGHIPDALNLPYHDLELLRKQVCALRSGDDDLFVLYCNSGHRSSIAVKALRKEGVGHVYYLSGGILTWNGPISKK
jgi:rhodanese-related sulfurtransferase